VVTSSGAQQHMPAQSPTVIQPTAPLLSPAQQQQQNDERQRYQSHLQLQLNQISTGNALGAMQQIIQHHAAVTAAAAAAAVAVSGSQIQPVIQTQLNQIPGNNVPGGVAAVALQQKLHENPANKYQRSIVDGDFEFVRFFQSFRFSFLLIKFFFQLKFLSFDDLQHRLNTIDSEMEREIDDLTRKYHAKRQPILDAMDAKRKRQQTLNNNLIKI